MSSHFQLPYTTKLANFPCARSSRTAVTGSFSLPFTAYFALLSARVVRCRLREHQCLGDDTHPPSSPSPKAATPSPSRLDTPSPSPLTVAIRSQANFVEYVPWALLLAVMAELNGANKRILNVALTSLLVFRVLHVEFGLKRPGARGKGRSVGYFGTMGVIGFLSGYTAYLVRGYWGFD